MHIKKDETDNYPVRVTIPVAWGEMDAFNHVNNIIYFRYFETARIKYFESLDLLDFMQRTGQGPILAETSCRYLQPLRYPDTIVVSARAQSMGKSSFIMEYRITSEHRGVVALGEAVVVMIDYSTGKKVTMPDEVRAAIENLEAKSLS